MSPRQKFHLPSFPASRLSMLFACALLLLGCDQVKERAGFADPTKMEAEGKAIGGACRHAGRGLEDCYQLNKLASKSAVFAGWKEMNEYMLKNNMQAVTPIIPPESLVPKKKRKPAEEGEGEETAEKKSEAEATDEKSAHKSTDKEADKETDKASDKAH
jgi:hypothetical protein